MRIAQSILQRAGIRQLPGICWYPAKRTEYSVNQGGTADKSSYSSLTKQCFVKDFFARISRVRSRHRQAACLHASQSMPASDEQRELGRRSLTSLLM